MKIIVLTIILLASLISANAKVFKNSDATKIVKDCDLVWINQKTKNIQFMRLNEEVKIEEKNQVKWLERALNVSKYHTFKEVYAYSDKINFKHIKYQQYYKNIPIEGAFYILHSKSGKTTLANGEYAPGNEINILPSINEREAFSAAIKYVNARLYQWESTKTNQPKGNLVILPDSNSYLLAYKYDIYALQPLSRRYIFVDAHTGQVVKTLNRIHESNVTGTAETLYNGTVSITTDSYNGSYRLRETGRGEGIQTYNLKRSIDYNTAIDFTDEDNYWNTSANFDNAAYDAHYGTEVTYDYYYRLFGRNSFDNAGGKIRNYVHFGEHYVNAFWNGESMTYGDGDSVFSTPLTSIDIVAHEITHAVTERTAGLVYQEESGALNESFSDIFGIEVDFYKNPATANYQIGEAISVDHLPFRDISNPNNHGNPDTYKGRFWDPYQEVHCNSGVQNYWYYLLCEGGAGTNDHGDNFFVEAIGREKAAQIAYRNLTVYLTPNSDYDDARYYSIQAAKDLFGDCSVEAKSVSAAWYAVGVGDANDCMSPENFIADQISRNQINLKWTKNTNNNNVLIAWNSSKNIGNPIDGTNYSIGSSIPGGGKVLYSGSNTTFSHQGLQSGTNYYYKAWSVLPQNTFSGGIRTTVDHPSVDAGEDQRVSLLKNNTVTLSGNYPVNLPYDSLSFNWKMMSGNGDVVFDNADSSTTKVHFTSAGKYSFQLTMNCYGFTSTDSMNVYVCLTDSIAGINYSDWHNWMGLDIVDNYAYLADLVYGVRILDISDTNNPVEISTYEKFNVKFIHVEGDYAYVSQNFGGGLTILNIKDKYNPTFVSYLDIPNSTENEDFILRDGIIYLTTLPDGIVIIDVRDPLNPVRIGSFPSAPRSIAITDNYLYGTNINFLGGLNLFILDISDPAHPREVKRYPEIHAVFMTPFVIQGEYMYTIFMNNHLSITQFYIYNISDRENPVMVDSTETGWNNSTLSVVGNYAYLGDGLQIIDISDKSDPRTISNANLTAINQLVVKNDLIYCTRQETFTIYKSYLDNRPPYVYAGIDQNVHTRCNILHGEIFDEGLPKGGTSISLWSKVSGPGDVMFSNPQSLNSTVCFSDTGRYVLRLEASDGELSYSDEVIYTVPFLISNLPPYQITCENSMVEFNVEVKSDTIATFHWFKDNLPVTDDSLISGSNTGGLLIKKAKRQDAGNYYCQIMIHDTIYCDTTILEVNTIPANAGLLMGDEIVCPGQKMITYTVAPIAGATSYDWTLPVGFNGTSASNTITVDFDSTATSGTISVKGVNSCGVSTESFLPVTINPTPPAPVITLTDKTLLSDAPGGNQWYNQYGEISNATNNKYSPEANGEYYVVVNQFGCSSEPSNTIYFTVTRVEKLASVNTLKVYPNPVSNELTIDFEDNSEKIGFEIINSIGQTVHKGNMVNHTTVQTGSFAPGTYLVKIENGGTFEFCKIIK
jgi:Zn-dependent metalloprotease